MTDNKKIPFSFELIAYPHVVTTGLADYEQFYSDVENLFRDKDTKLQEQISEKLKNIPTTEHNLFVAEEYGYDLHQNQLMFPSMHREATFITLYNFLEYHLNELCRNIGKELESNISLNNLNGRGIERALLYLKKIPEFSFEAIHNEFSFVKNTNQLRNCIVHSGGVLPDDINHKVNKFVVSKEYLDGTPSKVVIFRAEFIPAFIKVLQVLFQEIENEMYKFLDKYRTE